jgi:hypothetical protein
MQHLKHKIIAGLGALLVALLLAALAGLLSVASAQTATPAQDGPPQPDCYPMVNGYPVGMPKLFVRAEAWHIFWFCGDRQRTSVRISGWSCAASHCSEAIFSGLVHAITRASARVRTADEAWSQHVTVRCSQHMEGGDELATMCRQRAEITAENWDRWKSEVRYWVEVQE